MRLRIFTLMLLVCGLLAAFGTASAASDIKQISPSKKAILSTQSPVFTWKFSGEAEGYVLHLRSADGKHKGQIIAANAICVASLCSFLFVPGAHSWQWRDDTTYTWQIKAMDGDTVLAKSKKSAFTTNLLPSKIKLIAPATNLRISGVNTTVTFQWHSNDQFDQYRLNLKLPGGTRYTTAWQNRTAICTTTCTYLFDFWTFQGGKFKWHIEGQRSGVENVIKSAKRTLIKQ